MSLRDDHASNKRMIKSTAGESDYDNAVNNNVWLMDGSRCAKSVFIGVLPPVISTCHLYFVVHFEGNLFFIVISFVPSLCFLFRIKVGVI